MNNSPIAQSVAQILVENGIIQTNFENPFTWTSGIRSPIYCDCRELIGTPLARNQIVNYFCEMIQAFELPDVIAGTATAGIPWAAFVAQKLDVPMLYVRSKPKGHGSGKMVEGRVSVDLENPKILVLEDAISTAGSSIKSVEALRRECQAEVDTIRAIFTWSTAASESNAQKAQVELSPLTNYQAITEALLAAGKVNQAQAADLESFRKNPVDWFE